MTRPFSLELKNDEKSFKVSSFFRDRDADLEENIFAPGGIKWGVKVVSESNFEMAQELKVCFK